MEIFWSSLLTVDCAEPFSHALEVWHIVIITAELKEATTSFMCRCGTNVFQSEPKMVIIKSSFLPFADAVLYSRLFVSSCHHRPSQLDSKDKKKGCLKRVSIRKAMLW